ncbi:MAG: MBL fold metallo-hydrolase [Lachnospiraceae bacterium]|nr:MBL fold metallo-hydrolase [Bacteroides sp.]MCM1223088.1 MBL fold metallo-hydrolase [Lachnospiraceae bacterium]MCM1440664.1 MBL fold metallo-hydrolase [Roseburia sp.]
MELICLGSSSQGNCYILKSSTDVLLIECGKPLKEVKKALDFHICNIAGCIVSHQHRDHSKYLPEYLKCGICTLALEDVFASFGLKSRSFCKSIIPMHGYKVGGFKVFTLPVVHDVPCLGYVIEHDEMGKLLFVTDTMMLDYRIEGLNHIMIEANYSDEILDEAITAGRTDSSSRERLLESHMEIKTTEQILRTTDLTSVSDIVLLHLSSRHGNAEQFTTRIKKAVGKPVYVASPSFKLDISKQPY